MRHISRPKRSHCPFSVQCVPEAPYRRQKVLRKSKLIFETFRHFVMRQQKNYFFAHIRHKNFLNGPKIPQKFSRPNSDSLRGFQDAFQGSILMTKILYGYIKLSHIFLVLQYIRHIKKRNYLKNRQIFFFSKIPKSTKLLLLKCACCPHTHKNVEISCLNI